MIGEVERLRELLTHIQINNPFKQWMSPLFEIEYDIRANMIFMQLQVKTIDTESEISKFIPLTQNDIFYIEEARYLISNPRSFYDKIYRFMLAVLEHELEEAFLVDGVHWKDPHPENVRVK